MNRQLGRTGEEMAARYLTELGYRVLCRNERVGGCEIDIVAQDGEETVFVEVKTRWSHEYGLPSESITPWKIKTLLKTALFYIQKINWGDRPYRLDFVSVDFANDPQNPKIELIKNITS